MVMNLVNLYNIPCLAATMQRDRNYQSEGNSFYALIYQDLFSVDLSNYSNHFYGMCIQLHLSYIHGGSYHMTVIMQPHNAASHEWQQSWCNTRCLS